MKTVTFKEFENLLHPLGLIVTDKTWALGDKTQVLLSAKITSRSATLNDKPTLNTNASYTDLSGTGENPDSLAENIFQKMLKGNVLIGSYNNYTSIILWDKENSKFKKRQLTQREDMEINCIL